MHHARRREFVDDVLEPVEKSARQSQFVGDCLHNAAIAWGRLTFFIAIGLLLFAWPKINHVDAATLTGYALTILYLMSPLGTDHGLAAVHGWAARRRWRRSSIWA